jgi:hypothetical protein
VDTSTTDRAVRKIDLIEGLTRSAESSIQDVLRALGALRIHVAAASAPAPVAGDLRPQLEDDEARAEVDIVRESLLGELASVCANREEIARLFREARAEVEGLRGRVQELGERDQKHQRDASIARRERRQAEDAACAEVNRYGDALVAVLALFGVDWITITEGLEEVVDVVRARVDRLTRERDEARAAIADIDRHATPIGLLHEDDPEGSPHHYIVTVGALHRALGKAYTAEPCEAERLRLRAEVARLRGELAGASDMATTARDFNERQRATMQRAIMDAAGYPAGTVWPGNSKAISDLHERVRALSASSSPVETQPDEGAVGRCPDGGTCHHECGESCFRVQSCGPLSGVYPGDTWPVDIQRDHAVSDEHWSGGLSVEQVFARGLFPAEPVQAEPRPTRHWLEAYVEQDQMSARLICEQPTACTETADDKGECAIADWYDNSGFIDIVNFPVARPDVFGRVEVTVEWEGYDDDAYCILRPAPLTEVLPSQDAGE